MEKQIEVTYKISEEVQQHIAKMAAGTGLDEGQVIERLVMEYVTGEPWIPES
jgi:hypothetical protein